MGYSEQIEILKNALNGYSEDEEKLSGLYKTAIENAEKAHAAAQKQLEEQYYHDRNRVYADNARDERNANNIINSRGLGFSGENAQAKLNSNITLSNRLGELTREKNAASLEYDLKLAEDKSKLSIEHGDKLTELINNRNKLNADIAAMELEKESGDADRQAELDATMAKLQAEKENLNAQIRAEKENLLSQLQAEKQINESKLQAERDNAEADRAAEAEWRAAELRAQRESEAAKLRSESEMNAAKIQADKDAQSAQIQAEKEMQAAQLKSDSDINAAKLQAEKEMQEKEIQAELTAKYYESISGGGSESGSAKAEEENEESATKGFTPSITAKELAKQLVSSAGDGNRIYSEEHSYTVSKYLLDLKENYGLDSEYYRELILMLKSYGYEEKSLPEMKTQVISREAETYYYDKFNEYLDKLSAAGYSEGLARVHASTFAEEEQMDYIYSRTDNNTEFEMCCEALGIPNDAIEEYLNHIKKKAKQASGSSGGSSYATKETK